MSYHLTDIKKAIDCYEQEYYETAELIEKLQAHNAELLQELEDRYQQTKCGCSHPACKRCQDDRMTETVLLKARGETECTT